MLNKLNEEIKKTIRAHIVRFPIIFSKFIFNKKLFDKKKNA